ncbi:MAG: hypothetical protein M1118_14825 [Chloroflexi bacterium]|nr:hypothetical protein [Chloroflexota bacterium]
MSILSPNSPVALVQLPFPSQGDPLPTLVRYYAEYERKYSQVFPEYQIQEGDLWEMPLWVAHLDGAIGRDDTLFVDLSRSAFEAPACAAQIQQMVDRNVVIFLSPLAQNFSLARAISRLLLAEGYRTVVGGNMADLANPNDFTWVYVGLARAGIYEILTLCNESVHLLA